MSENKHNHIADVNKMVTHLSHKPFEKLSLKGDKVVITEKGQKSPIKETEKKETK